MLTYELILRLFFLLSKIQLADVYVYLDVGSIEVQPHIGPKYSKIHSDTYLLVLID